MIDVKILSQKENELLNRKELTVLIESSASTPKKEEVTGKIAALLNADKGLVVVGKMQQQFGSRKCNAYAKVYGTADDLKKTEPKKKEKKGKGATAAPAAAQAAPAAQPAPAPATQPQKPAEKK